MPAAKPAPIWVRRLRAVAPRGWTVSESAGRIRLQVRRNGKGQSVTLPLDWAPESFSPAVDALRDLEQAVADGRDVRDAARRLFVAGAPDATGTDWAALVLEFKQDLMVHGAEIAGTTWKGNYEKFLSAALELLSSRRPPVNAAELVGAVAAQWQDKPRSRALAVQALQRFLQFGVRRGLPAGTWTLDAVDAKRFRGRSGDRRIKATLGDVEILAFIDALPATKAGEQWANAFRLMALYGLRPEELNHLQPRQHPHSGVLMLFCTYRKVCGGSRTAPRWLLPCPLIDGLGESISWELPSLMQAGLLPLPSIGTKDAVGTFLKRQPAWQAMRERCATNGEWLRPYVFRDSYSLRCHRRGIETGAIASAMGHSLAVHSSSYRWADETQTAQAFAALS